MKTDKELLQLFQENNYKLTQLLKTGSIEHLSFFQEQGELLFLNEENFKTIEIIKEDFKNEHGFGVSARLYTESKISGEKLELLPILLGSI